MTNTNCIITTKYGNIKKIEFYSDVAPETVKNFKKLAKNGFYDGLIFHRIVPGFVIQGRNLTRKIWLIGINGGQVVQAGM